MLRIGDQASDRFNAPRLMRAAVALSGAAAVLGIGMLSPFAPQAEASTTDTLTFAQVEGYWVAAGGPASEAATAAAIASAESASQPGAIQAGEPYSSTGWGLWQITPGNSESVFGQDFQLLDPWNNAEAAVAKYNQGHNFQPWTTYTSGAYSRYLPQSPPTPEPVSDPGQYVPGGTAPAGVHNASQPGMTYGPPMPGAQFFTMHADGSVWGHSADPSGCTTLTACANGWKQWDAVNTPNKTMAVIPSAFFVMHTDGSVWAHSTTGDSGCTTATACGTGWQQMDAVNAPNIAIAATSQFLFTMHTDGSVWRHTSANGNCSTLTACGTGWTQMDAANAPNKAIAAAGQYLYTMHTDGSVWQHISTAANSTCTSTTACGTGWTQMDAVNAPNATISVSSQYLFTMHTDGSVWRHTSAYGTCSTLTACGTEWTQMDAVNAPNKAIAATTS